MSDCRCGRIRVGMKITENRNWNPDCPEHGTDSYWYHSDAQSAKRQAQAERTASLQAQARAARRRAACDVCNGTGLAYDSTECRMVPCGGICCVVKS